MEHKVNIYVQYMLGLGTNPQLAAHNVTTLPGDHKGRAYLATPTKFDDHLIFLPKFEDTYRYQSVHPQRYRQQMLSDSLRHIKILHGK